MYNTARITLRQTSKDVTQPTQNDHLGTCIGDYASNNRSIKQGGIKQPLKQTPKKRTIMHPTEPTSKHIAEAELNKAFAEIQGEILGGLFDVIVKALQLRDSVLVPETDFRLADFFKWGYLLSEALGFGGASLLLRWRRI